MNIHLTILEVTLDPKLTYITHTVNIATNAHKALHITETLNATSWGKQKETFTATYKAFGRVTLEHASSSRNINKLQKQNLDVITARGCAHGTNTHHLHDKTIK